MRRLLLVGLLALRIASVVQPAGSDQGIYAYTGQRILAGGVPYRDAWDQKPPAIGFLYAAMEIVWPRESLVPAADLVAAAAIAVLLVGIGRKRFSERTGYGAAAVFLLFGDPYLLRLGGVLVRAQCETFIALAVTGALACLASQARRRRHLIGAGICLGVACWLKYNAIAYVLPAVLALWSWPRESPTDTQRKRNRFAADLLWIAAGLAGVSAIVLAYFAAHHALHDLWLATISYNLKYSEETYAGRESLLHYLVTFPLLHAEHEMIWFLGGLGGLALAWRARQHRPSLVALGWVLAAVLSIVINGGRELPQYFVQANPALALAASAGMGYLFAARGLAEMAAAALVVLGFWKVGVEPRAIRLGGLPELAQNVRRDVAYLRGHLSRTAYLSSFRNEQKFDALEIDRLSSAIRSTTTPADPVYVFGFSGGSVCWKSGRESASRFSWSRPVLIEFAATEPGYGSAGLLADLERRPPVIVALQKESQWRSREFFMSRASLRDWLEAGYKPDHETPMFDVWRRKP